MVKRYKIVYWENGNKHSEMINASSKYDAKMRFYRMHNYAEITSIEEVD